MLKAFARVSSKLDKMPDVANSLKKLAQKDVYVGIPEGDVGSHEDISNPELMYILTHGVRSAEMREEMDMNMGITAGGMPYTADYNKFLGNMSKGMPYSAAFEMFLHEHGSPLWHTPPRPILEPAIEHSKDMIAKQLQKAAVSALDGQDPTTEMQKAGMLGVNVARDWFTNPLNLWAPNADSTKKTKNSDRPNVDTGNLRNSITFVVADK